MDDFEMKTVANYGDDLLSFLWQNLRKANESKEEFQKRIEGRYFSEELIDIAALRRARRVTYKQVAKVYLFNAQCAFLILMRYENRARSKIKAIIKKVDQITEGHSDPDSHRSVILYYMLILFFFENHLKTEAKYVQSEVAPEFIKEIEVHSHRLNKALENLVEVYRIKHNNKPFQEWYLEPIKKKASDLGCSISNIQALIQFIEQHKKSCLEEIEKNKLEYSYAKRDEDYSPLSRDALWKLCQYFINEVGIQAEQSKRYIAELFDLFEIRTVARIIEEFRKKEEHLSNEEAVKISAKRLSDVMYKRR